MMKNKLIITIMFGIFLLSMASIATASYDEVIGPYEQYECINLPQASDAVSCNITTIRYPQNSSFALRNVVMQKNGTSFNYTFCDTSKIGTYIIEGTCDGTPFVYPVEITTTGTPSDNKIPIFLLVVGFILLFGAFLVKSPPIGFFAGVMFIMVGMYLMIYGFGDLADLYTRSLALVMLALGSIVSILAGFSMMDGEGDEY